MSVLIHFCHGKPKQCWLVDTPARMDGAKRSLFSLLDGEGCYNHLRFDDLLTAARQGSIKDITAILKIRNGIEGETWAVMPMSVEEDKSRRYAPFMAAAMHNLTKQYLYGHA